MPKQIADKIEIQAKTGLTLIYSYLLIFIINASVIYFAHVLFPTQIVLGTFALSPLWALILVSGKLTLIDTAIIPLVYYQEWKRGRNYTSKEWMLTYFVVNSVAIWLISRFADKLGFGISRWYIAVLLGTALDWVQGMGMLALEKVRK